MPNRRGGRSAEQPEEQRTSLAACFKKKKTSLAAAFDHGGVERETMAIRAGMCESQEFLTGASSSVESIAACCHHGDVFQGTQVMGEHVFDKLPGVWMSLITYIHLCRCKMLPVLPACLRFLRSWRRYPKLVFNNQTLGLKKLRLDEEILALKDAQYKAVQIETRFASKIDHILRNHSGFGVKVLILQLWTCPNIDASCLDKWLQIAVKPGIEELAVELSRKAVYNFPSSLLWDEMGGATVQSLRLSSCSFHPTTAIGCSKNLTSLCLYLVRITGEELGQFVSNCLSLIRLSISNCNDIICFKVSCPLHQLDYLQVTYCEMLQVIEISAPKLSTFVYGENLVRISLGAEVKCISLVGCQQPNMICQSRIEVPSFMPVVERLTVKSGGEMVKTPVMPSKFLCLKYLDIFVLESLCGYDYFSLVSFLVASPLLETFIFHVECCDGLHFDSILSDVDRDQLHSRQMSECRHDNLKNVRITGFSSAKSMIELVSYIVQNTSALCCLTLDTARGCGRRNGKIDRCSYMSKEALMEAQNAVKFARHIQGSIPSSASFHILVPCSKCGCAG
ncbi:hypothetical protein EJB05_04025 [Eragrostis curvula]|uniref:At1g61320/AtMIF1 LRR domain-containing protein n=1 Tax=Eragrostis curvula TaxID=38414 RepID=A0A5J9WB23_9POAL|nr:hypothetical protein EJB05_04025 [Eragrostis curvula]